MASLHHRRRSLRRRQTPANANGTFGAGIVSWTIGGEPARIPDHVGRQRGRSPSIGNVSFRIP